jgi:hypothetical protein
MRQFRQILFLLLILVIIPTPAQEKKTISLELRKKNLPFGLTEYVPSIEPVIGLALSGGGARAISQLGALRAFEEAGIEADVIVGTSMGSILEVWEAFLADFMLPDTLLMKWIQLLLIQIGMNCFILMVKRADESYL